MKGPKYGPWIWPTSLTTCRCCPTANVVSGLCSLVGDTGVLLGKKRIFKHVFFPSRESTPPVSGHAYRVQLALHIHIHTTQVVPRTSPNPANLFSDGLAGPLYPYVCMYGGTYTHGPLNTMLPTLCILTSEWILERSVRLLTGQVGI